MGNTSSTDFSINETPFDKFPMNESSNETIQHSTKNKPTHSNDNEQIPDIKSTNTQNLKELTKEISSKTHDVNLITQLKTTFEKYNENVILDFYESDDAVYYLKKNDIFAIKLAELIPKNNRPIIHKYFIDIPVEIIIIMKDKLDFNALSKGYRFLYYSKLVIKNLSYVCNLIENIDNIDLNLTVETYTFLDHILIQDNLSEIRIKLMQLFQVLDKKKYNFNHLCCNRNTFLTQMIISHPKLTRDLAKTILLDSFDFTVESRWLYLIVNDHLMELNWYIYYMFQRTYHKASFIKLYNNLHTNVWNDKFNIFLKTAVAFDRQKTIKCMNYVNEDGDTIIHLMAKYHDKITLQFCVTYFNDNLKIKPNNLGKTPSQLYNESKIINKLNSLST